MRSLKVMLKPVIKKVVGFMTRNVAWVSHGFASRLTPWTIRRALRGGLHAIYFKGDVSDVVHSSILAPTHHSWWDGYLVWLLGKKLAQPLYIMMAEEQLKGLEFLRSQGVCSHKELRFALRHLQQGAVLTLFPEGELRSAQLMTDIQQGLAFFSGKAKAVIYPLVLRVVMRGAEKPDVFIALGQHVDAESYISEIRRLQQEVAQDIRSTHPEQAPQGYAIWQAPQARFDVRMAAFFATIKARFSR